MPQRYFVPCCCNYGRHRFPKDSERRMKWRIAIKRSDPRTKKLWEPSERVVVCHLHFVASDNKDTSGKNSKVLIYFIRLYSVIFLLFVEINTCNLHNSIANASSLTRFPQIEIVKYWFTLLFCLCIYIVLHV